MFPKDNSDGKLLTIESIFSYITKLYNDLSASDR